MFNLLGAVDGLFSALTNQSGLSIGCSGHSSRASADDFTRYSGWTPLGQKREARAAGYARSAEILVLASGGRRKDFGF
jgi:hypothetical protein